MVELNKTKLKELHGKDLVSYLNSWNEEDTERYSDRYREWEKNILFYMGKHWLEPASNIEGWSIVEPQNDFNRYLPVTNYIKHHCKLKRSQILGKRMQAVVKPNSETKEDYDAALLSTLCLKARNSLDGEETLDRIAFLHGEIFGISYRMNHKEIIENKWLEIPQMEEDRNEFFACGNCGAIQEVTGPCMQCGNPNTEFKREVSIEQVTNPDGTPAIYKKPIYRPATEVIDPFRIRMSPAASKDKIAWIIDSVCVDIDWVKTSFELEQPGFFPEEARDLEADKSKMLPRGLRLSNQYADSVVVADSSVQRDIRVGDGDLRDGQCVLHRLYLKPCTSWANGRLIIWTHSGVLYDCLPDVPLVKNGRNWHPYSIFVYELHPMNPEGIAYINEQIPLNMIINSLDAMILEHTDKMSMPKEIHFSGTVMNNSDGTDIVVVEPRPELQGGGAPFYISPPSLPNELYRLRNEKVAELKQLSNITDAMQGIRPAGVDTWKGLEFLRETSNSSESDLFSGWYDFKKHSASMKLKLIQECLYYDDDELRDMMESIRENEEMSIEQIRKFTGAQLNNNVNVVYEEADYAGQSQAAEVDMIIDLIKSNLIDQERIKKDSVYGYRILRKLKINSRFIPDARDCEKMEILIKRMEMVKEEFVQKELQLILSELKRYDKKSIGQQMMVEWMKTPRYMSLPKYVQFVGEQVLAQIEKDIMQLKQPAPPVPQVGQMASNPAIPQGTVGESPNPNWPPQ